MYCRYCGHEVENDSRFCLNCGKIINEEATSQIDCQNEKTTEEISFSQNKQDPLFRLSKLSYCTNCGSNMGNSKACPSCHHKKNNGIDHYCAFCSAPIENGACSNSNVVVKTNLIEKLLRFISIFLICFSFVGVFVKAIDGDYLSAIIMGGISLLCNLFTFLCYLFC